MTDPADTGTDRLDDFSAEELEMAARLGDQWDASRGAPFPSEEQALGEIAPLLEQAALLRSVSDFEFREDQHTRGLSEVLRLAEKKSRSAPQKTKPKEVPLFRRLLVWSPLPAVAVLALVYAISGNQAGSPAGHDSPSSSSSRAQVRAQESSEPKRSAPVGAAPWELAEVDLGAEDEASETSRESDPAKGSRAPGTPASPRLTEKRTATNAVDSSQVLKAQAALLASRMGGHDARMEEAKLDLEMRGYRTRLLARLQAGDP